MYFQVRLSGRQRSRTLTRQADVDRFAVEMEADLARGQWLDPAGAQTTLDEWSVTFWSLCRRLEQTSQATYERDLRRYVVPRFGDHRIGTRVAVAVTSVGAAYLALLKSTTPSQEGDFFDSPWFWWGWLVLPAIAAGAAWIDANGSAYWGWLVVAPQAVATVVEGALLHDPNQGASFWPVGLIFVGLFGCLASGAASLAAAPRTPNTGGC